MSEPSRLAVFRMPNWLGDAIMALPALDLFARRRPGVAIVVACRASLVDLFRAHPAVSGLLAAPTAGWNGFWQGCLHPYRVILPGDRPLDPHELVRRADSITALPGPVAAAPAAVRELSAELRKRFADISCGAPFDGGVLFPNSLSSALWLWRLGAGIRLGYRRDARGCFLTHRLAADRAVRERHMTDYYLQLARAALDAITGDDPVSEATIAADAALAAGESTFWPPPRSPVVGGEEGACASLSAAGCASLGLAGLRGSETDAPRDPVLGLPLPVIPLSRVGETEADRLLRLGVDDANADAARTLVLAPVSAYGPVKDWPPERYSELVGRYRDAGWRVFLTGTTAQAEVCDQIGGGRPGVHNLAGRTTLAGFLSLLRRASLFVGGDSGGAHAAAAMGTPTVAIYGLTEPARTRQLGRKVEIVGEYRAGPEAGCEFITRPLSRRLNWRDPEVRRRAREVLAAISCEQILDAATRLGAGINS